MNWYALYTKPKNEIKAANELVSIGIEAYCPVQEVVKQWSDRKKKVISPLISSYIFVKIEEKNRSKVFAVPGIVRYIFWLGKPAIIKENEIIALRESLLQDYTTIITSTIKIGDKLTIDSGPFKGMDGIVNKVSNNKTQVILESLGILLTFEK